MFAAGIVSGLVVAGLFNPWDRSAPALPATASSHCLRCGIADCCCVAVCWYVRCGLCSALYLSVLHERPFMHRENFLHPYKVREQRSERTSSMTALE